MHSDMGKLSTELSSLGGNSNTETEQKTANSDRSVSPPRADDLEDPKKESVDDNTDLKIKTESDFKFESFKHSFADQHNLQMFRSVLEGVNKQQQQQGAFRRGFSVSGLTSDSSMLCSEEEQYEDSVESEEGGTSQEERKVRVRTLISEEQQMVLKAHYQRNPKPKKEVLQEISSQIGHPFRVVKVWFQNMRARDRREGRHIPQLPFPGGASHLGSPLGHHAHLGHHHPAFLNNNNNNSPFSSLTSGLPLPLLRPPLPGLAGVNHPLFSFPGLHSMFDLPKTPDSVVGGSVGDARNGGADVAGGGGDMDDDIEDDDEDEEDDVDVEFETPLDLSNKGSTPGGSPAPHHGGLGGVSGSGVEDDDHIVVVDSLGGDGNGDDDDDLCRRQAANTLNNTPPHSDEHMDDVTTPSTSDDLNSTPTSTSKESNNKKTGGLMNRGLVLHNTPSSPNLG